MRRINNKTFGGNTATRIDERIISFDLIGTNASLYTYAAFYSATGQLVGEANYPLSAALITSKAALLSALEAIVGTVTAAKIITSNGSLHKIEYTVGGVRGVRTIRYELSEYSSILPAMESAGSFTLQSAQTSDGKGAFLIIGDSIAFGTSISGKGPTPLLNTVFEWDGSSVNAISNNDLTGANTGSQYPRMGIDVYAKTNIKPVFVNAALPGSSIVNNGVGTNWSTSGTLYAAAQTKASAALSFLGLSKLSGIILICGINDARSGISLSSISSDTGSLFDRLNANYPGVPVFVGQIGRSETDISNTRIDEVRGYISSAVSSHANCYMAADLRVYALAGGLYSPDLLHLNQAGCNKLGAALAASFVANF